jgi:hypothetical protein
MPDYPDGRISGASLFIGISLVPYAEYREIYATVPVTFSFNVKGSRITLKCPRIINLQENCPDPE